MALLQQAAGRRAYNIQDPYGQRTVTPSSGYEATYQAPGISNAHPDAPPPAPRPANDPYGPNGVYGNHVVSPGVTGPLYTGVNTSNIPAYYRDQNGNLVNAGGVSLNQGYPTGWNEAKYREWMNGMGYTPQQQADIMKAHLYSLQRGVAPDLNKIAGHIGLGGSYNRAGQAVDQRGQVMPEGQSMVDSYRGRTNTNMQPGDTGYAGSSQYQSDQGLPERTSWASRQRYSGVNSNTPIAEQLAGDRGPPADWQNTSGSPGTGVAVHMPEGGRPPGPITDNMGDAGHTPEDYYGLPPVTTTQGEKEPNTGGAGQVGGGAIYDPSALDTTGQGMDESAGGFTGLGGTPQNNRGAYANSNPAPGYGAGANTGGGRPSFGSQGGATNKLPVMRTSGGSFSWSG